ncbi:patatin-like phospholipase domain-containing protein 4 isoform X1 [Macrobrachium nipponense]|uniref:patatin-like phospholipase domain-containing protein 4 isoform X1 n=1 Tax=Macrobrachium nipponense TaxID=159736 RepID=UPI0030C86D27
MSLSTVFRLSRTVLRTGIANLDKRRPLQIITSDLRPRFFAVSSVFRKDWVEVTFETVDGSHTVKGKEGDNLLDVVINNDLDLDGFGACEGTLSCSTCHLIFKKEDFDKIEDPCTDEELDMLDLAYGLSDTGACVSLSGSGFLGIYQLGAVECLQRFWPQLLEKANLAGASAGAVLAACIACSVPTEKIRQSFMLTAVEAHKWAIGPFNPNFKIEDYLRTALEVLPPDAHVRANDHLFVSLSKLENSAHNVLISNWESREDLISCLLCSCFIPVFSGITLPTFRGEKVMDGGFTNNLPTTNQPTITISPFNGVVDICPVDNIRYPFYVTLANECISVTPRNLMRFVRALLPPPVEDLESLYNMGYWDAYEFLKRRSSQEKRLLKD